MLRITLSLALVALGVAFSNTPHTGCNDAAPEVVQALTAEQGYAQHQFKSCGDIAAAGGCARVERVQRDLLRVVRIDWRTDENDLQWQDEQWAMRPRETSGAGRCE